MPLSWRRALKLVSLTLLAAGAAATLLLWHFQERLIYPAPHYVAQELRVLPAGLTALRDPEDAASVIGFFRAPAEGKLETLWLAFGGNGDLALRWDPILAESARSGTGVLMVEYPGYGARAGSPSPETLLAGTEASVQALAKLLGVEVTVLEARISVLGYSIGGAAALAYAARHPVQRVVLVAPFTSMLDMARISVGRPLCNLLRHRYDNVASLRTIQQRRPVPLTVLHGQNDHFIPSRMGAELAAQVPGSHFELIPGADHGDVIELAKARLLTLLAE